MLCLAGYSSAPLDQNVQSRDSYPRQSANDIRFRLLAGQRFEISGIYGGIRQRDEHYL